MTREEIERKLKETIVSSLDLEDLAPEGIESDIPLFGEGLGREQAYLPLGEHARRLRGEEPAISKLSSGTRQ